MNCWHCNTELIWGNDHDVADESEEFSILSILSCPKCNSLVEVYYPKENDEVETKMKMADGLDIDTLEQE